MAAGQETTPLLADPDPAEARAGSAAARQTAAAERRESELTVPPAGAEAIVNDGDESDPVVKEKLVQAAKLRKWLLWIMLATIVLLITIIVAGVVLRRNMPRNYTSGCPYPFDPKADYFPDKVQKREANADFTVTYGLNYKVMTNLFNNEAYLLVQCNTFKPELEGSYKELEVAAVAVGNEFAFSAHAVEGYLETVTSPCLQYMISINQTTLLRRNRLENIDLVFMGPAASATEKKEVAVSAGLEESPLEAVEWLQYIGAFYNLEREALVLLDGIRQRYQCRRERVFQAARRNVEGHASPVVTFIRHSRLAADGVTIDSWRYDSTAWREVLVRDAGGDTLIVQNTSFFDLEELKQAVLETSDVVIETGDYIKTWEEFLSVYQLNETDSERFPFLQGQAVYRLDKRINAQGYSDMVAVISPGVSGSAAATRRWLRQLATEPASTVLTAADCPDKSTEGLYKPLPPSGAPC